MRPTLDPRRIAGLFCALAIAAFPISHSAATAAASAEGVAVAACEPITITAPAVADTWVAENNTSAAGGDALLKVEANLASGNARTLVRFRLPSLPAECVVESARLRLYTPAGSDGSRVEAALVGSAWSENDVTWSHQPAIVGPPALAWSTDGYLRWNVTAQVQSMYETGVNHGFAIRDPHEGTEVSELHGFNSKEKGENPPELVIRFAPPPTGEAPPPAPPAPAFVRCGQVLTESTLVANDLKDCLGDGLVIGAPRIIVDLDGHTIDGTGLGTGILNDGFASITIRNGKVEDFDYGVRLMPDSSLGLIEQLALKLNQVAAIELFEAADIVVRDNRLDQNGGGIELVNGTTRTFVAGNSVTANGGAGLLLRDADFNWLEHNRVTGGGDLGIGLEHASGNTVNFNVISGNSDGGIELGGASNGNRIEGNTLTESGDSGILVSDSDRNHLIGNISHKMSDSGIGLNGANDTLVSGNDVRFNSDGLQIEGSRNVITLNNASETTGNGIELAPGAFENQVVLNTANGNSQAGIFLEGDAAPGFGNLIERNTTNANKVAGISVAKGVHALVGNAANNNVGWGISVLDGLDGGGNVASGNGERTQCSGVACRAEWVAPETTITGGPTATTTNTSAVLTFAANEADSRFECALDHAPFAACASPRQYTGLAAGAHQFRVRATDAAGNQDATPASLGWTIEAAADTTPPATTITSGPGATSDIDRATFAFSASEAGSTFECSLDGSAFTACASPRLYTGLAAGPHQFRVRATDAAGNQGIAASYSWTITAAATCGDTITLTATGDAWVEQNSPSSNKGTDSVLKVRSKGPRDNARALIMFALPPSLPAGCVVDAATLRLYSDSARTGRTLQALRLSDSWSELGVTWSNQPAAAGPAVTVSSTRGNREWNVAGLVQAMYDSGAIHGFLIRDAVENQDAEQSFHSREKDSRRPQLVFRLRPVQ